MSKRAHEDDDNVMAREAKRLHQDLDALHARWSELDGYPSLLLPEIHRLIAYKLPIGEMVKLFETHSAFTLEKNPTFHIALWSTLVDVEFRSPFTREPYRIVKHFRALLERVGSTLSEQDKARFWRAAYSRCHMAVRTFLVFVMMRERVFVTQSTTGVQRDILPERWRHLLNEEWRIDIQNPTNDWWYGESTIIVLPAGDRIGLPDDPPVPRVTDDLPAAYNLRQNNWLCLHDEMRRVAARGDMFRWTPEHGVHMAQTRRRVDIWPVPDDEGDPNEPRGAPPSLVDVRGDLLPHTMEGRFVQLPGDGPSASFESLRTRCVTDVKLLFGWDGFEPENELQGKVVAGDPCLHFVTRHGHTVMSGSVYGDYEYAKLHGDTFLEMHYGWFVHNIDMDAYVDWLVDRTPADKRGDGLVSLFPEELPSQRHEFLARMATHTRALAMQLDQLSEWRSPTRFDFRLLAAGKTTIQWFALAIWDAPFDEYLAYIGRTLLEMGTLAELPTLDHMARLLVAWMTQPGAPLVHFSQPMASCARIPIPFDDSYKCSEPDGMDDAWVEHFLTSGDGPRPRPYEIGRGGSGIVMANDAWPQWAVKTSKHPGAAAAATRIAEFNAICAIRGGLATKTAGLHAHPYFRVAHVPYLVEDTVASAFVIERIVRPKNAPTESRLSMQAYMGTEANTGEREGRGDYVGLPVVLQMLGLESAALLMAELGRFVGAIQYGLGYDLGDVEYLIGHTHDDPRERIYLVDFDRCRLVDDWTDTSAVVEQLSSPLWAEPYFPSPASADIFDAFSQGYLASAASFGRKDIAEAVLREIP